jgi:D-sedoheptulose 7-phosphate isomerase
MDYLKEHLKLTTEAIDKIDTGVVEQFCDLLMDAFNQGKQIFFFGNGGSAATASHFCQDLAKGTLASYDQKKRFRSLALTDNTPAVMAWGNDYGYEHIFEQQLRNLAGPGDVAVGISGSGNSPNVLNAIEYAKSIGMETVGMTGYNGGKLKEISNHQLHVELDNMEAVETVHSAIGHAVVTYLRKKIND